VDARVSVERAYVFLLPPPPPSALPNSSTHHSCLSARRALPRHRHNLPRDPCEFRITCPLTQLSTTASTPSRPSPLFPCFCWPARLPSPADHRRRPRYPAPHRHLLAHSARAPPCRPLRRAHQLHPHTRPHPRREQQHQGTGRQAVRTRRKIGREDSLVIRPDYRGVIPTMCARF